MYRTAAKLLFLTALLSLLMVGCSTRSALLKPSGRGVTAPADPELEFAQYVSNSRDNIRNILDDVCGKSVNCSYLGGYTIQEAAMMRAPFQIPEKASDICGETSKGGGKGFLLIHGLTDSPYMMRSIGESLKKAYPCAVIRALLLPGHGTVPGDTLTMTHEQWLKATDYGVRSFEKDVRFRELYLVGFSTGTVLALQHMKNSSGTDKVKGLILLSPAVKARTSLISLSPIIASVTDWESVYAERDAARYESFSFNAAAEFYRLTKELANGAHKLDVPLMMVASADDATVDSAEARRYFCNSATNRRRALIWYRSPYSPDGEQAVCRDIATVEIKGGESVHNGVPYRVANISHLAVPVAPGDSHYGVSGAYRNCKVYEGNWNPDNFTNCLKGSAKTIFGENNIGTENEKKILGYDYWRRGTFNPDYERLEKSIICFADSSCDLNSVLDSFKAPTISQPSPPEFSLPLPAEAEAH